MPINACSGIKCGPMVLTASTNRAERSVSPGDIRGNVRTRVPGIDGPNTTETAVITPVDVLTVRRTSAIFRRLASSSFTDPALDTSATEPSTAIGPTRRSRLHTAVLCALPPTQPRPHASAFVCVHISLLRISLPVHPFVQPRLTHFEHRVDLHTLHCQTFSAFVAMALDSGAQRQPLDKLIPPATLLWLHHFERSIEGEQWLLSQMQICAQPNVAYCREVIKVCASLYLEFGGDTSDANVWTPTSGIQVRTVPLVGTFGPLYKSVLENHLTGKAPGVIMYNLRLRSVRHFVAAPVDGNREWYTRCELALRYFCDQCIFTQTQDFYLHLILKLHLPATETVLTRSPPYHTLSEMLAQDANDIIRPYIDTPLSQQLKAADIDSDDVVVFVLLCTIIVEIEQRPGQTVRYNDEVNEPCSVPTPFVLCDFPIHCVGNSDAYGYMHDGTLFVGNGFGVATTISAWIEASKATLPNVSQLAAGGSIPAANLLAKYIA